MKKILSIIGIISLITIGSSNLIACDNNSYISTSSCKIKNHGDWKQMCQNDNLFKNIDNKYYIVIWYGLFKNKWKINKFNNNAAQIRIDTVSDWLMKNFDDLQVGYGRSWKDWKNYPSYFKAVYRWDGVGEPNIPKIDNNGNIIWW